MDIYAASQLKSFIWRKVHKGMIGTRFEPFKCEVNQHYDADTIGYKM